MFSQMLGRGLKSIHAVVISVESSRYALDNTLVFELEDGKMFQLLVGQTDKILRPMVNRDDLVLLGEYDGSEQEVLEPIRPETGFSERRLFIREIREYWADDGKNKFLMGVVFSDPTNGVELPILTGGTEAEIVSTDLFATVIREMAFPYEVNRLNWPRSAE